MAAVVAGAVALTGWTFDVDALKSVVPGFAPMPANTAAGFVLLGLAAVLLLPEHVTRARLLAGYIGALLVGVLACLTLLYSLVLARFGHSGAEAALPSQGHMSYASALVFLMLATALCLTAARRGRVFAELFAVTSICVSLLILMGDAFRVCFPDISPARRSPLPAKALFLGLGGAILVARPESGWAAVVLSPRVGGFLARRLLPAAVLVPTCLGWLQLYGETREYVAAPFGTVVFVLTTMVVFSALTLQCAAALNQLDDQHRRAEEAVRASEGRLRSYNERLKILHQIDKALVAGQEPEQIAATALPLVRELLGVGRAIVNLFDLAKGEVEWLAAAGRRRVHAGPGVRYSLRFMGDVAALQKGEHQFIDTQKLPPGPEVDALRASGVYTYAVVPMIARGELIGALSFGGSPVPISADQMGITQEVATQFAVAITNARLYERVKRQAQELEARVRERTQELEAAQATLRETNAELEAFSYSVSHDLRSPLRAIDGFSRLLLEKYSPALPAEAKEHLQEVRCGAREMGQLIDDLLAFARLGRQAMQMQKVRQDALVRECLQDLQPEQAGRRIDISVQDLAPAQGDAALLKQVWLNLLSNALKYTSKQEQACIEIGSRPSEEAVGEVLYFVRDNGVGFDMQYVHHLFGVFQRLHRADEYEGTGVGLAIVQRIIHRHGGRVWAEARPGQGAAFYFTLRGAELER
jgi:signal transduction histidine kinase